MPGIAGVISPPTIAQGADVLRLMLASMTHERSYAVGCVIDAEMKIAAGWVAHRGSYAEGLNVCSTDTTRHLLISGEIFAGARRANSARTPTDRDELFALLGEAN